MSDEATMALLERLEALTTEIRRQGRASIAAQAAAESCASTVDALRAQVSEITEGSPEQSDDSLVEHLVRALMPVADSVDRMGAQAARLVATLAPPGLMARLVGVRDQTGAVRALADGLSVLAAQLDTALRDAGVEIDREVGVAVDGEAHRVVEARAAGAGDRPGCVLEIVRPGYWLHGRCLREADVVASKGNPALPQNPVK